MRQSRMGLIQTVDQLKFSYMAIAEGARQANLINSDSCALSAILPGCNKVALSTASLRNAYGTVTAMGLDSTSSSDSSSDFDYGLGPPPLPPPRSESLQGSGSNRHGVSDQLSYQRNQQVYINGNDGSGPGLLLPADIAEMVDAYNDIPQNLAVSNRNTDSGTNDISNENTENIEVLTNESDEFLPNLGTSSSISPTKYILNNHKLEERKR